MTARVIQGSFPHGAPRVAPIQAKLVSAHAQRALNGTATPLPPHLTNLHSSPGQPLPPVVQRKMEQLFGARFSDVRVHVAPQAAAIGAHAFTSGTNIYFAPGKANFDTLEGQRLLAHELGHVVQQRAGRVVNPYAHTAIVQDRALEAEAARMAARVTQQPHIAPPVQRKAAGVVQCITIKDAKTHLTKTEFALFEQWLLAHSPGDGPDPVKDPESLALALMVHPVPTITAMRELLKLYERQLVGQKAHDKSYEGKIIDDLYDHLTKSALLSVYATGVTKLDIARAVSFLDEATFFSEHYKTAAAENASILTSPEKVWNFKISQARKITQTLAFEHGGTIFLRQGDASMQIAVHELLHKMSAHNIATILGPVLNEGLTETIARLVCAERHIPITEEVYVHQRNVVTQLLKLYSIDQPGMLNLYFRDPQSLRDNINATLGIGAATFIAHKDASSSVSVFLREREAECQRRVVAGALLETTVGKYVEVPAAIGNGGKTLSTRVTEAITAYDDATKFRKSSETTAAIIVLRRVTTHHQLYAAVRWYLRHDIQQPQTVVVGSKLKAGSRFDGLLSQAYTAWGN